MLSGLKELIDESELARIEDIEEISTIGNLDWQTYESLLTRLEDNSHYRVTYLNGVLEIVSPSLRHEKIKKRLATLLERYLVLQQIQHTPMGSTTLKNQLKHAGAEPDECYYIVIEQEIPDLAILVSRGFANEVNITSGNINKLAIYQQLGVKEVWFWEVNCLNLYCLREEVSLNSALTNGYERVESSDLLPDLNIALLSACTLISDQLQSMKEFEQGM
jgi:Uma2 family endonuclease